MTNGQHFREFWIGWSLRFNWLVGEEVLSFKSLRIFILWTQQSNKCWPTSSNRSGRTIVIDGPYPNRHHQHHGCVLNSAADAGGQPYLATHHITHHRRRERSTLNNNCFWLHATAAAVPAENPLFRKPSRVYFIPSPTHSIVLPRLTKWNLKLIDCCRFINIQLDKF